MNQPRALLLDEPLGALDLRLRRQLQIELKRIQQDVGITFVHVTHDQEEALTMADTIAVMNEGRIEQMGSGEELYERPRTEFVANFLGISNLIDGKRRSPRRRDGDVRGRGGRASCSCPSDRSGRTTATPSGSGCGRRRSSSCPAGEPRSRPARNVAARHGHVAELPRRLDPVRRRGRRAAELTVIAPEHGTAASRDSIGPGRDVSLAWDPDHTFVVARSQQS